MLHNGLNEVKGNETVEFHTDCPATKRDMRRFCAFLGHNMLHSYEEVGGIVKYWIKKNPSLP